MEFYLTILNFIKELNKLQVTYVSKYKGQGETAQMTETVGIVEILPESICHIVRSHPHAHKYVSTEARLHYLHLLCSLLHSYNYITITRIIGCFIRLLIDRFHS